MHYVIAGAYSCHKRAVPLELELQAVVKYLMWMLEPSPGSSAKAVLEQSLQTPRKINFNLSSSG